MAQRANIAAGFVTVYAVPEPRSFILTNTFTFRRAMRLRRSFFFFLPAFLRAGWPARPPAGRRIQSGIGIHGLQKMPWRPKLNHG